MITNVYYVLNYASEIISADADKNYALSFLNQLKKISQQENYILCEEKLIRNLALFGRSVAFLKENLQTLVGMI